MKCLIIDKVYAGIAEELSKYMEVKTAENLPSTKDQLLAEIGDVDVLIMRVDPKIDQEIIDAAKNLKVIGVCSVGLNHIDMDYAKSKGIQIFNAPKPITPRVLPRSSRPSNLYLFHSCFTFTS